MDCCGKIGEVLSSILDAIKPLLAIVLVCIAVYFMWWAAPGAWSAFAGSIAWMPATVVGLSNTAIAVVAFGAAILVDPETTVALTTKAATAVGSMVSTVVGAVATGVVGGLFGGNGTLLLIGALAAWYFLFRDKDGKEDGSPNAETPSEMTGGRALSLSATSTTGVPA